MSNSSLGGASSGGDVVGPASATDGDIAIFDGTTGKLIADSGVGFPIPEASGGTNQTTYTQGDILYSSALNTLSKLAVGDPSDVLMCDSNGVPVWKNPDYVYLEDDFIMGNIPWLEYKGGGCNVAAITGETSHPGIVRFTIASTNGAAIALESKSAILLSGGRLQYDSIVRINSLSDGTDTYELTIGLTDANGSTSPYSGVYFYYTHTANTGNWIGRTKLGAGTTDVNSSVAVTAGAWVRLSIVINAAASSMEFFVNGTSFGSSTTNLPTAANMIFAFKETAGTGSKTFDVDFVRVYQELTTARF